MDSQLRRALSMEPKNGHRNLLHMNKRVLNAEPRNVHLQYIDFTMEVAAWARVAEGSVNVV